MRAIVNDGARVALGREPEAIRDAEGQIIGSTVLNGQTIPAPRYSAILPTRDFDGDIEQACLTAGQSAGNIDEILPAGEIVRRMTSEAKAALDGLAAIRQAARCAAFVAADLAFDGIKALTIGEAEEPRPQANEVLINVHAASVSYMDYLMACGGFMCQARMRRELS